MFSSRKKKDEVDDDMDELNVSKKIISEALNRPPEKLVKRRIVTKKKVDLEFEKKKMTERRLEVVEEERKRKEKKLEEERRRRRREKEEEEKRRKKEEEDREKRSQYKKDLKLNVIRTYSSGHKSSIRKSVYFPNLRKIVSISMDGSNSTNLVVWDFESGEAVNKFYIGHEAYDIIKWEDDSFLCCGSTGYISYYKHHEEGLSFKKIRNLRNWGANDLLFIKKIDGDLLFTKGLRGPNRTRLCIISFSKDVVLKRLEREYGGVLVSSQNNSRRFFTISWVGKGNWDHLNAFLTQLDIMEHQDNEELEVMTKTYKIPKRIGRKNFSIHLKSCFLNDKNEEIFICKNGHSGPYTFSLMKIPIKSGLGDENSHQEVEIIEQFSRIDSPSWDYVRGTGGLGYRNTSYLFFGGYLCCCCGQDLKNEKECIIDVFGFPGEYKNITTQFTTEQHHGIERYSSHLELVDVDVDDGFRFIASCFDSNLRLVKISNVKMPNYLIGKSRQHEEEEQEQEQEESF